MTNPPRTIQHNGNTYRLIGKNGRPPKKPKTIRGHVCWHCPCCDKWKIEFNFGNDKRACNGLKSWCRDCVRALRT